MKHIPIAMTIAGSDSVAGAGIQADLKTFAALGVYGVSVITAVTAQNTLQVMGVQEITPEIVSAQIEAVLSDMDADTVKTGMLSSKAIIHTVSEAVHRHRMTSLVVDPVMVTKGGDRLLQEDAMEALRIHLLPLATVVTPNGPEAEALTSRSVRSPAEAREAARAISDMGADWVVVKGGHLPGAAVDTLFNGHEFYEFQSERIKTRNTHGTGCTFASAIAAGLAKELDVPEAVRQAKEYVTTAIRHAFAVGQGHGPLNHFYRLQGHSQ